MFDFQYCTTLNIYILLLFSSFVELAQGGTGGLSVLRTFRLLRILKLVRFMPALRYQLVIMLKTMDSVATFFALLVLFIFIFRFDSIVFFIFLSQIRSVLSNNTPQMLLHGLFLFNSTWCVRLCPGILIGCGCGKGRTPLVQASVLEWAGEGVGASISVGRWGRYFVGIPITFQCAETE